MATIEIDKKPEIFDDSKFCFLDFWEERCCFLVLKRDHASPHSNHCPLFKKDLEYRDDINGRSSEKCDECKKAWINAKHEIMRKHFINCGDRPDCPKCQEYIDIIENKKPLSESVEFK